MDGRMDGGTDAWMDIRIPFCRRLMFYFLRFKQIYKCIKDQSSEIRTDGTTYPFIEMAVDATKNKTVSQPMFQKDGWTDR